MKTATKKTTVKFIEDDGRKWYEITGHDYIDDGEYAITEDGDILDCDGAPIDERMKIHFDIIKDMMTDKF